MNDEFLYQARPKLRGEFADELYAKLSENYSVTVRLRHITALNQKSLKISAAILIGLVIFVACARQLLEPRNVQVGKMWVQEGNTTMTYISWGAYSNVYEEPVLSSPPDPIPVDEALETLPYKMKIPEWAPEGFSLSQDKVAPPIYPSWMITLTWSNSQNDQIMLLAHKGEGGEIRVPRGMWEEVSVNGLPAVLVRGDFPWRQLPPPDSPEWETGHFELIWDKNAGLQLFWNQGGARFSLEALGNFLDEDDLIRMAVSMRTW